MSDQPYNPIDDHNYTCGFCGERVVYIDDGIYDCPTCQIRFNDNEPEPDDEDVDYYTDEEYREKMRKEEEEQILKADEFRNRKGY